MVLFFSTNIVHFHLIGPYTTMVIEFEGLVLDQRGINAYYYLADMETMELLDIDCQFLAHVLT